MNLRSKFRNLHPQRHETFFISLPAVTSTGITYLNNGLDLCYRLWKFLDCGLDRWGWSRFRRSFATLAARLVIGIGPHRRMVVFVTCR